MKLIASMIVRNELGRYLEPCLDHLLSFCDEIRILDDGSADGTFEHIADIAFRNPKVWVLRNEAPAFFRHEGAARQQLLDYTIDGDPTHILAIDADEFITDGHALRAIIETNRSPTFALCMTEIWKADMQYLHIRCDGAWSPSESPLLYAVPPPEKRLRTWMINPKPAACGREPVAVRKMHHARQSYFTDVDILHLGWTNEAQRRARHARYDSKGGFGHMQRHIESIMYGDDRVSLERWEWPAALLPYREAILAGVTNPPIGGSPEEPAAPMLRA